MKKHILPVLAFLVLSSCTPVEDFGAYWDKGFVDPALEGRWQKLGLPGEDIKSIPGADQMLFMKDGQSYAWYGINPGASKEDNETHWEVRSLKIGSRLFLAQRDGTGTDKKGMIDRYEIHGDLMDQYIMENGAGVDFLRAKHPTATNIGKNQSEGNYVAIKTFDDEVFQILSEMADDPEFWVLECQYKKIP